MTTKPLAKAREAALDTISQLLGAIKSLEEGNTLLTNVVIKLSVRIDKLERQAPPKLILPN